MDGLVPRRWRPFLRTLHFLSSCVRDACCHQAFKYIVFNSRWEDSISGLQKSSHMTVFLPHFEDKEDSFFVCFVLFLK